MKKTLGRQLWESPPAPKYVPLEMSDIKLNWKFKYKNPSDCEDVIFRVLNKNKSCVIFHHVDASYTSLMTYYLVNKQDGTGFVKCHKLAK